MSDDRRHLLTIIGFVGSVFSPYYARARRHGPADPESHCAINVALYGPQRRWAMTERGHRHIARSADRFSVGPSSMCWQHGELVISIDERCMPLPFALRGEVRVRPTRVCDSPIAIDGAGQHFWRLVAPACHVTASFDTPKLQWSGTGYHDMNWGSSPLESAFRDWTWARAETKDGTAVLYDVTLKDGTRRGFGKAFEGEQQRDIALPPQHHLPRGLWRMARPVLSESPPRLLAALEDAPFYTRNHVRLALEGQDCEAVHESLSLERFVSPVVQRMLPFRMPRVG